MDNKRITALMDSLKTWLRLMQSRGYSVQEIDKARKAIEEATSGE